MQVLQKFDDVIKARKVLKKENLSFIDSKLKYFLRRAKLVNGVSIGDLNKSWDILEFKKFLLKNIEVQAPILDIGCYGSEILLLLNKLGYINLTGIDLNGDIFNMPHQDKIRYKRCDFMKTTFEDGSFKAITSVSVIEHGLDTKKMLAEMSRILKANGFLLISFDYWPEKIDTSNMRLFDMDWNIFSRTEIKSLIKEAQNYNLQLINESSYEANVKAITHVGFEYTFGIIIFKKV
ncbi:class I SAM-dependent methyltransferase [Paracoccaceae bacterium]|nr:class I SAM-dependent methyltransferase [Paracoccaceae bacterium]